MNEREPVSIKYIDKEVYQRLCDIAASKGKKINKKTELFEWIMKDYIDMHDIDQFRNPYLLTHISSVIESATSSLERRLGGRMFTIVSELAINLNVLTVIIHKYMNKYTDAKEAEQDYRRFRQEAIDELRSHDLAPMTYLDIVKKQEGL